MPGRLAGGVALVCVLAACAGTQAPPASQAPVGAQQRQELARQVREAELGFAATMARRDHAAFGTFVADEALFFGPGVLRGHAAVVEGWKPLFDGAQAPFSWEPESVEVLDSGTLAISTGPVRDPQGRRVGTFNSIWRLEPDGRWRVVFDKGCPPCAAPPGAGPDAGAQGCDEATGSGAD